MLVHGRYVFSTIPCLFNALLCLLNSSVLLEGWEDVCHEDVCHEDVCRMMRRSGESLREIGRPGKYVTESRNKRDRNAHHLIPPLPYSLHPPPPFPWHLPAALPPPPIVGSSSSLHVGPCSVSVGVYVRMGVWVSLSDNSKQAWR